MSTTGTAIVTGGSQGIGAGPVTRFLEKGYNVVGNSRAISKSTNLTPSPRLALVDGDIGDCATAQKITDTAIARFGRIDVLVNNAGLLLAGSVSLDICRKFEGSRNRMVCMRNYSG
jgi:NAD(P)-dependent dehydrogenase (short-subunit alcohol dehydrogenase family)